MKNQFLKLVIINLNDAEKTHDGNRSKILHLF